MEDRELTQERRRYFHELTEAEFKEICKENITWEECARRYRQPKWCSYPGAVCGVMGCWSLMSFMVENEEYCKNCDCYSGQYGR